MTTFNAVDVVKEAEQLVNDCQFFTSYPFIDSIFRVLSSGVLTSYIGRKIAGITLSETEEGSYYIPAEDTITISYPSIAKMLEGYIRNLSEEIKAGLASREWAFERVSERAEQFVRTLVFHEASHVFLTPSNLMYERDSELDHYILNVLEDERIETINANFFLNTDFKGTIMELNQYTGEEAEDATTHFYHTVRFRAGEESDLDDLDSLILSHARVTASELWCWYIRDAYFNYFYKVTRKWLEKHEYSALNDIAKRVYHAEYSELNNDDKTEVVKRYFQQKQSEGGNGGDGDGDEGEGHIGPTPIIIVKPGKGKSGGKSTPIPSDAKIIFADGEEDENDETEGEQNEGEGGNSESDTDDTDGKDGGQSTSDDPTDKDDELEKKIQKALDDLKKRIGRSAGQNFTHQTNKAISDTVNHCYDAQLINDMNVIFQGFLNRQRGRETGVRSYSGRMDVKSIGRKDWRVWTRRADSGPIHGFSKCHFTLFIDVSGSYANNKDKTNTILNALCEIERKYDCFHFDVVTMSNEQHICSKKERYINPTGGNDLDPSIFDIVKKMQKKDEYNYNIVLFDGDAYSDSYGKQWSNGYTMGAFNGQNFTIISDEDNKKEIEKYAPTSKKIFVGYRRGAQSYPELLFEHFMTALKHALS